MGEGKETVIGYDVEKQQLFIDRSRSGLTDFHEAFTQRIVAPLPLPKSGRLKLQVILDRSSVEVFADDGTVYLAAIILPDKAHLAMAPYETGSGARLRAMQVHLLGPRKQ